jgi:hypothetical protein
VPWQRWSQLFSRVLTHFSTKGLKLQLRVEVVSPDGISEQQVQEVRGHLKELGLSDDVKITGSGG